MDAAANHRAALCGSAKSGGDETTDRREEYRRVEEVRRRLVRSACPIRVEVEREILRRPVAGAGEGIDPTPLVLATCATMCAAAPNP